MRNAFIITFGVAMLVGLYLVWRGGWVIVLIGSISIFLGVIYTASPYALAYTGLADIFVLIFFGPVAVGGTYYVQALTINATVLVAGLAPGLISTALLTVNNLRDAEQDRAAGRKTLAVRFGRTFAKMEYLTAIALACFVPIALHLFTGANVYAVFATATFLFAIPAIKTVFFHQDAAVLNTVLASTGKLLLIFSLVFSIGWIIRP
jgi:1,4-dihydroxy-2-naphthoate octaprenyltransferase